MGEDSTSLTINLVQADGFLELSFGEHRDFGLGSTLIVLLEEARRKAEEYRRIARSAGGPLEEQKVFDTASTTFDELAVRIHEDWINKAH